MKDKFDELAKVGQTVLQMINDLHQDKEQFGAQSTLPSPDGKYNFVVRVFREGGMLEATDDD